MKTDPFSKDLFRPIDPVEEIPVRPFRFLPIALLCAGLLMCAQKESASDKSRQKPPAGPAQPLPESRSVDWIEWPGPADTLFLIKVADSRRHKLKENYLGNRQFEEALKQDGSTKFLLHILIPNQYSGIGFRYRVGGKDVPLENPTPIFRMPGSPLHTFVIVDSGNPGLLEGFRENDSLADFDLAAAAKEVALLPLHWEKQGESRISYRNLPPALSRKRTR